MKGTRKNQKTIEFIADCMLGKLARWLRILGFDTLYYARADDAELADIAARERRVLLTRDTRLIERKNITRFILIHHDDVQSQLKQVIVELGLCIEPSPEMRRCPACNGLLRETDRSSVTGRVPLHIYRSRTRFRQCSGCGKIFWKGSHYDKISQKIRRM